MARVTRGTDVTPSARRLTGSLRDIGYDFTSAVADLVDNSVAAGATRVDIEIVFDGPSSYVLIADDGRGMTEGELHEALRFGTRRSYARGDLGRYGLGLKTASISQCRRLTVVSRRSAHYRRLSIAALDVDHISETDRWELIEPPLDSAAYRALEWLGSGPGTFVLWEGLDRVLPASRPAGGWARRRLESLAERTRDYLGMVFHRFLEGEADRDRPLVITVNGEKAEAWNPFAPLEEERLVLPEQSFELAGGTALLRRFVLPPRDAFSSVSEFERLSGPLKWNRQQGIYVYRADRLIQGGGWFGIRSVDEHTKFARASLDFQTDLDETFHINVAKMRVSLPPEMKSLIERPVHELCHRADSVYRRDAVVDRDADVTTAVGAGAPNVGDASAIGAALFAAALEAGEQEAITRIMKRLKKLSPETAAALGW